MDLSGRRKSTNVEDRRSGKGGKIAGVGIGGAIIAALIAIFMGGDPSEVIQQLGTQGVQTTEYTPTEQEEQLKDFAEKILASTEDVWSAQFKKMGKTYTPPTMVLFHGSVQSGCPLSRQTNVYILTWTSSTKCLNRLAPEAISLMPMSLRTK